MSSARESIKKSLQVLLLLNGVAWINSIYSLWHRQSLLMEGITKPSFCNVNSLLNCDAVAMSRFSQFLGLPVAAWGLVFYSVFFILALGLYFRTSDAEEKGVKELSALLAGLSLVALFPTVTLALISFSVLKLLCIMCLLTYLLNILILVFSFRLLKQSEASFAQAKGAFGLISFGTWALIGCVVALTLFAPTMMRNSLAPDLDENVLNLYVEQHFAQPAKEINTDKSASFGPSNAPVTVVAFSDFQCPFCQKEALSTPEVLKQYEGRVRYVFKNYPLDPACNPNMKGGGHPLACVAAKTAQCVLQAKGPKAFFDFKHSLFKDQETMTTDNITSRASAFGIAPDALKACVEDAATHQRILDDINQGTSLGVSGTPSVYINGRKLDGVNVPLVLQRVLERHFAQAK